MGKLAFNKTNLNKYKEQLIVDIKRKKLSINPKTENGLLKVIKYIDKKGIELSELFNVPNGVEPGDVIELLLSNGDLDSIYTEFELPLEPEEEIADSISDLNKKSNNKYYIDGYQYGKKLKEDTKFEYMTQETLDKIKKYRENN